MIDFFKNRFSFIFVFLLLFGFGSSGQSVVKINVRPGAVRIASNETKDLSNVAFKTTAGKTVLIVANGSKEAQTFNIDYQGKAVTVQLDKGSVATYIW